MLQTRVLVFKSLVNVTATIKKTQLSIYDKFTIYSKSSYIFTCMYTQVAFKLRAPLLRGLSTFILACHVIVTRFSLVVSLLGF